MAKPRQLKSEREIGLMRVAGLAVWKAHQIATELVAPGVSTLSVDTTIENFFKSINAEPLFQNYPNSLPGKGVFPSVCCMSVNDAVVHGFPTSTPLQEGDIVSIDTGARINGWCGDAAVTYPVGKISEDAQKLLDVTKETLGLAIELLAVKNNWADIAEEMQQYVKDHGFATVECFVGHGIGKNLHEDPQVPNYSDRTWRGRQNFAIEPGLVIAVEPMVNVGTKKVKLLSDGWTQVTLDGHLSAHFEHTIAIRENGPQLLTAAPLEGEKLSVDWL